jgi:MFS superfamily sulfate permease-like transporter
VVSFLISFGVAKRYAIQRRYDLDSNQDLMALGIANAFGSLFGAIPAAGPL